MSQSVRAAVASTVNYCRFCGRSCVQSRSSSECLPSRERHLKSPVNGLCPLGFYRHHRTPQEVCRDADGRRHRAGRVCRRCTTCPPGFGATRPCGQRSDTVCEACVPGISYADLTSHEQPCLRCTQCSQHAVVQRNCSVRHDAICHRCRKGNLHVAVHFNLSVHYEKIAIARL